MKEKKMSNRKIKTFVFIFVLLLSIKVFAQEFIDFESDQWDRANAQIVQFLDRKCLIGSAFLKDAKFENGVIEVDIAVSGQKARTYPGVLFRVQSQGDYERFYIRPHRASLFKRSLFSSSDTNSSSLDSLISSQISVIMFNLSITFNSLNS
jgi:hypothetical protein